MAPHRYQRRFARRHLIPAPPKCAAATAASSVARASSIVRNRPIARESIRWLCRHVRPSCKLFSFDTNNLRSRNNCSVLEDQFKRFSNKTLAGCMRD